MRNATKEEETEEEKDYWVFLHLKGRDLKRKRKKPLMAQQNYASRDQLFSNVYIR